MDDFHRTTLGRTGLPVCRLGVACSYGAPAEAFEEAFDHGVNYFYFGGRRTGAMAQAVQNILSRGDRDHLIILIQSYSRSASLMELFFRRALQQLGIDGADILAVSGHNRPLFPLMARNLNLDILHVRYNAAHRGAEKDIFPELDPRDRPGIVSYTATRWGDLLNPRRMPEHQAPLTATDCYRFVLSNPSVDVCMTGPKTRGHMREALEALELGPLSSEEMARVRLIGDHVHATSRRLSFG